MGVLLAVVTMSAAIAATAVTAVPALAQTERQEFKVFAQCPLYAAPIGPEYDATQGCFSATLAPGSEVQAGSLAVRVAKPVTLSGGFEEDEATGRLQVIGAEFGNSTLQKVAQPIPNLTEDLEPALLSPTERARYEKTVASGRTSVFGTVELAAPPTSIELNETNLLAEEGTGIGLPVEVKLSNPFLGETCYVGSNSHPIEVPLTTGVSGALQGFVGSISVNKTGHILIVSGERLVSNTFSVPEARGCGKDGSLNAAINAKLDLPSPGGANSANMTATLEQASAAIVAEVLHP